MDSMTVETSRFEHREPGPHFINPHCFGEDFASWLRGELAALEGDGVELSEPIQEDYGWGLWARRGTTPVWIALSFVGDEPDDEPAQWVVSVAYDPGLNILARLFRKPDAGTIALVRDAVWSALARGEGIRVVPDLETS